MKKVSPRTELGRAASLKAMIFVFYRPAMQEGAVGGAGVDSACLKSCANYSYMYGVPDPTFSCGESDMEVDVRAYLYRWPLGRGSLA